MTRQVPTCVALMVICLWARGASADVFSGVWALYEPVCSEFMIPVESCPKTQVREQIVYEIAIVHDKSRICGRWQMTGVHHNSGYLAGTAKGEVANVRVGDQTSHSSVDAFPNHGWRQEIFQLRGGKLYRLVRDANGKTRPMGGRPMIQITKHADLVSRLYADDEVHPGRTEAFLKACTAGSNYSMQPTPKDWRG